MENEIDRKVDVLDQKIDAIYLSVEKMRKYFFWTMVITVALVVFPMIGLIFAIPAFLGNYVGGLEGI
jgi:hypothetical protein